MRHLDLFDELILWLVGGKWENHLFVLGLNIVGCSSSIAEKKSCTFFPSCLSCLEDEGFLLASTNDTFGGDDGLPSERDDEAFRNIGKYTGFHSKTILTSSSFPSSGASFLSTFCDVFISFVFNPILFEIRIIKILLKCTS